VRRLHDLRTQEFDTMLARFLSVALAACVLASPAQAQKADTYPSRPITLIVPFTPGGGTDIMARMVADKLSRALGQPVLVDNRPGAGGTIGTEQAARAEPNGYTLMMGSVSTISINPSLYKKLAINPLKDLAPVGLVASTPSLLAVPVTLPVNSVQELIAYAKANPGKVNFGSAGNGTSHHLSGELFKQQAGIDAQHIPYKGSAPALLGLIRGDVQFMIANVPSMKGALDGKQIKGLALTSLDRSAQFPEYKTVNESGLPGFEVIVWYGIFAPAGTPEPIINRLNAELRAITAMPDVRKKLTEEGAEPLNATPREFAQRIQKDYEVWKKVVDSSGAKID
jgi:tripartite-type tricarboxylate transporter receptor subunit TctC